METILLHKDHEQPIMAGVIRSRRTKDPSSFIRWSAVPSSQQQSPENSIPLSPPVSLPLFSPKSFYTLGSQSTPPVNVLPRSSSVPSGLYEAEESKRIYPNIIIGGASPNATTFTPDTKVSTKSLLTKQACQSCPSADFGPVFDEENDVDAIKLNNSNNKFRQASKKGFPLTPRQNDKNIDLKKCDRKHVAAANSQHSNNNQLRRASSTPTTGIGCAKNWNKSRTMLVARAVSSAEPTAEDEKWAGPAYSKSPPPSSLPFPKFSVQPMRSLSMEMTFETDSSSGETTSSSLPSPSSQQVSCNCWDTAFATKDLKRILNLDQQVAT